MPKRRRQPAQVFGLWVLLSLGAAPVEASVIKLRCTGDRIYGDLNHENVVKTTATLVVDSGQKRIEEFPSRDPRSSLGVATFEDGDAHLSYESRVGQPLYTHLIHIDLGAGDLYETTKSDDPSTPSFTWTATCRRVGR